MFEINEINKYIGNVICANDYSKLVEIHKYTFFQLLGEDSLRFFWIKTEELDIQFIIDFRNQLYYLCKDNKIVTLGERISDFEYQQIVRCYNCEELSQQEGMITIGSIIKSISEK